MSYPSLYVDDDKSRVNSKLFSEYSEEYAKRFSVENDRKVNKSSQLRKFYDQLVNYRDILKDGSDEWDNVEPLVKMLIAKVAYSKGRNHLGNEFHEFLTFYLRSIATAKDLEVFVSFFESVLGFYKIERPKE